MAERQRRRRSCCGGDGDGSRRRRRGRSGSGSRCSGGGSGGCSSFFTSSLLPASLSCFLLPFLFDENDLRCCCLRSSSNSSSSRGRNSFGGGRSPSLMLVLRCRSCCCVISCCCRRRRISPFPSTSTSSTSNSNSTRPFPHSPLPPPHVLPDVLHLLPSHRLKQIILGAQPDALEHRVGVLVGRHHHHGHGPQGRVRAHVPEELDAVDVGHHDVGEDEVEGPRGVGAELVDGLEAGLDVGDWRKSFLCVLKRGLECERATSTLFVLPLFFFKPTSPSETKSPCENVEFILSFFSHVLRTFVAALAQQARHDHPLHPLVVDEQDVDVGGRERGSGGGSGRWHRRRRRIGRRRRRRIEASSASALAPRRRRATSHPASGVAWACL